MAPLLKAARAISMEPYAVIKTMGRCGSWRWTSLSRSMPLRSGRLTSSSIRSKGRSSRRDRPDEAVSALATRYPSVLSRSSRPSRISDSSSMTSIDPLDMHRFPDCREFDVEGSATSGCGANINFSGMFLNDSVAHAQAETGATASRLGREKRIKNLMDVLARDSVTGIGHVDFHGAVVRSSFHLEHASLRHGIPGVQEKIQKYLLQLVRGATHGRERGAQLLDHLNLGRFQRMRHQRKGFLDDPVHVHVRQLARTGARKVQQIVHDLARPEGLLHDLLNNRLSRVAVRHLLRKHLDVVRNDREGRVDFVRHPGRQNTERGQLLGLGHLLFHAFALRHIIEQHQTPDFFAGLAYQR